MTTLALKPYQEVSRDFLAGRNTALLADQPRVGKSPASIRAVDVCLKSMDSRVGVVVVVCPAHLRSNWVREIRRWRQGNWFALVVSYNKAPDLVRVARYHKWKFDVLIVDESHFAKAKTAQRSMAVYGPKFDRIDGLSGHADRVWALSGTPQPNNPGELWTMLHALAPDLIMRPNGRPMTFPGFEHKYCAKIMTPNGVKIVGSKNSRDLKAKLAGFSLRRTRLETLGLDLQPWSNVVVEMPADARRQMKSFEESAEGRALVKALARGGLKELKKQASAAAYRKMVGLAKVSGIAALVSDELDSEGGKIVIGCHHLDVIERLRLALLAYHPLVINGAVADKLAVRDRFTETLKHRVLIVQNIAGGTGLDLSAADNFLSAEIEYVGADNEQVSARIFNTEKRRACFRRFAVLAGSLDEKIIASSTKKLDHEAKVFS